MRIIDADKLLERLPKVDFEHDKRITMSGAIIDFSMLVLDLDVVDAVPVVHGKWLPLLTSTGVSAFGVDEMTIESEKCSVCGHVKWVGEKMYYCPHCGAKMDL